MGILKYFIITYCVIDYCYPFFHGWRTWDSEEKWAVQGDLANNYQRKNANLGLSNLAPHALDAALYIYSLTTHQMFVHGQTLLLCIKSIMVSKNKQTNKQK